MPRKPRLTPSPDSDAVFGMIAVATMQQAPTSFAVYDAALRPSFLNAAGREMIGLADDADITVYQIGDFFMPQDRILVEEVGLPTMLREGRWAAELCFRHFNKQEWQTELQWSIFALHDNAGDFIGAAALTADIIAYKQTEWALRDQQKLLASVLDNLPLGVGVYNRHGDLIHSKQRMRDYTGLARLPSRELTSSWRWRGYDSEGRPIPPERYPGARALQGEHVTPGMDFLYGGLNSPERLDAN